MTNTRRAYGWLTCVAAAAMCLNGCSLIDDDPPSDGYTNEDWDSGVGGSTGGWAGEPEPEPEPGPEPEPEPEPDPDAEPGPVPTPDMSCRTACVGAAECYPCTVGAFTAENHCRSVCADLGAPAGGVCDLPIDDGLCGAMAPPTIEVVNSTALLVPGGEGRPYLFPSIVAHLAESVYGGGYCAELRLGAGAAAGQNVEVSVRLRNFSEWATSRAFLRPGNTTTVCATPVYDLGSIARLEAPAPSTLDVELTLPESGESSAESVPVEVLTPREILFPPLSPLALFVLANPTSRWVRDFQAQVEAHSTAEGGFSTGGYVEGRPGTWQLPGVLPDAGATAAYTFLRAGEATAFCVGSVSGADFLRVAFRRQGGDVLLSATDTSTGACVEFSAPETGWYEWGVRPPRGGRVDGLAGGVRLSVGDEAWTYLQAIFEALRADGIRYANLNSITGRQVVRTPSDVGRGGGANCVEGALTFAALAESYGVDPLVTVSFVNHHSFGGIVDALGDPWFIETTMVGSPNVTFWDAMHFGGAEAACWFDDIDCAGIGATHDPDARWYRASEARDAGFRPQPFE